MATRYDASSSRMLATHALNPRDKARIVQSGKRGFSEHPKTTGAASSEADAAEQAHKHSRFILNEMQLPWPRLESLKKSGRSVWTIPSIKSRIAELKKEHRQQLAKAIKYHAYEEDQLRVDEYLSFVEDADWTADFKDALRSFHRTEQRLQMHQADDFISRLRYTHIMTLKPLYEKLRALLIIEEDAKNQRARQFPKSSQAWRQIDTRDAKLKVAKFLLMDKKKQDEMLEREPNWRSNRIDVDSVVLEFKSNLVFSQEVSNFVKGNHTTDPRRRAT